MTLRTLNRLAHRIHDELDLDCQLTTMGMLSCLQEVASTTRGKAVYEIAECIFDCDLTDPSTARRLNDIVCSL